MTRHAHNIKALKERRYSEILTHGSIAVSVKLKSETLDTIEKICSFSSTSAAIDEAIKLIKEEGQMHALRSAVIEAAIKIVKEKGYSQELHRRIAKPWKRSRSTKNS